MTRELVLILLVALGLLLFFAPFYFFASVIIVVAYATWGGLDPKHLTTFWFLLWTLCFVGWAWVFIKLNNRYKKRQDEKERKSERLAAERAEEDRQERAAKKRRSAKRAAAKNYENVLRRVEALVNTCGSQAVEIARVARATSGASWDIPEPAEIVLGDIWGIFEPVRIAAGDDEERSPLFSAIWERLGKNTSLDRSQRSLNRSQHPGITDPFLITLLAVYDKAQGTTLASVAAETYLDVVAAAHDYYKRSVAVSLVADQFVALLERVS